MTDRLKNLLIAFLRRAEAVLHAFLGYAATLFAESRLPPLRFWLVPTSVSRLAKARKWHSHKRFHRRTATRSDADEGNLLAA